MFIVEHRGSFHLVSNIQRLADPPQGQTVHGAHHRHLRPGAVHDAVKQDLGKVVASGAVLHIEEHHGLPPGIGQAGGQSRSGEVSYRIPIRDILYFFSDRRKLTCVTRQRSYSFYGKLDALETELGSGFVRIHQRYLVRAAAVDTISGSQVCIGETALPVSRSCQQSALLGNALDNSMEAAVKAPDKRITLRCRVEKGMLMLKVSNALTGEETAELRSTKADSSRHGFGLPGMREIAGR